MIRLLYRFIEPKSGKIFINGQDIGAVDLLSLRKEIAIVPQDSVLFHNTIGYNINYGDISKSHEQVVLAARMAEIHDSINRWPHQYDTQVYRNVLVTVYIVANQLIVGWRAWSEAVRWRKATSLHCSRDP